MQIARVAGESLWNVYNHTTPGQLDLSQNLPTGFYSIVNINSKTINAPVNSTATCIIISNEINELLIAIDESFIYGKYKGNLNFEGTWKKLF